MTVIPYLEDLHCGDPPSDEEVNLENEADEDYIFNLQNQEQPAGNVVSLKFYPHRTRAKEKAMEKGETLSIDR